MNEEVLTVLSEIKVGFLMTLSIYVSEFLNLGTLRIMLPASSLPLILSLLELSR